MASWPTCLTMRAKQSCWAASWAQYFIRLQSLNRQLSTDHVIRPHQRDSIDSCSFKLASVLDDWVQPVQKPEPSWWFNVSFTVASSTTTSLWIDLVNKSTVGSFLQRCVDESCKCAHAKQFDNHLLSVLVRGVLLTSSWHACFIFCFLVMWVWASKFTNVLWPQGIYLRKEW